MTTSAETAISAHHINPHLENTNGLSIFLEPPSAPHLCVIPRIQQLFFPSPFLCLLFVPSWAKLFLQPPLLLVVSLFPVSVNPCHKNELNLSPLVQTTMEWGSLLENKSAFRPFWGCGEGVGGWGRRMRSRSDGRVAAVLVY